MTRHPTWPFIPLTALLSVATPLPSHPHFWSLSIYNVSVGLELKYGFLWEAFQPNYALLHACLWASVVFQTCLMASTTLCSVAAAYLTSCPPCRAVLPGMSQSSSRNTVGAPYRCGEFFQNPFEGETKPVRVKPKPVRGGNRNPSLHRKGMGEHSLHHLSLSPPSPDQIQPSLLSIPQSAEGPKLAYFSRDELSEHGLTWPW